MNQATDHELVLQVRGNNQHEQRAAFEQLVRRHSPWMSRMLVSLAGNRADDIAQDAFVTAYQKISDLNGEFRPWLRTIAVRLAYRHFRRRKVEEKYEYEASQATSLESYSTADQLEDREAINLSLKDLPYVYREIIVLRYVEELTLQEIAALLDLGISATKMRLKRARDEFRLAYEGLDDE